MVALLLVCLPWLLLLSGREGEVEAESFLIQPSLWGTAPTRSAVCPPELDYLLTVHLTPSMQEMEEKTTTIREGSRGAPRRYPTKVAARCFEYRAARYK